MDEVLKAPRRRDLWRESRVIADAARMLVTLATTRRRSSRSSTHVILLPGFGYGDRSLLPLRRYLDQCGYSSEGWGLGVNRAGINLNARASDLSPGWRVGADTVDQGEAGVAALCDLMTNRVRERTDLRDKNVALVGWSLGGYVAREVARDLPSRVHQVVTMGSPVYGGPKYTRAATYFRKRGLDLDWIEREVKKRYDTPIQCPITAIYSKTDAIVGWAATIDRDSPQVRHVEVDASHLGLGINPRVWRAVVEALDRASPAE